MVEIVAIQSLDWTLIHAYSILIVAANSATDDPETVVDVTPLGSRYLVLVVGTEDAKGQLTTYTHMNIHNHSYAFCCF